MIGLLNKKCYFILETKKHLYTFFSEFISRGGYMAELLLYVILGALAGILFGMRRLYILENRIIELDSRIGQALSRRNTANPKKKR